jgi:hypothetical protein
MFKEFCPETPKGVASLALRLSFGISLLLVGLTHYMNFEPFQGMVVEGLGALEFLGMLWAYLLPALMIVGGALYTIGMYHEVAAWCAGLALGSIPVGMLLKPVLSGAPLPDVMAVAVNTFIWILVYYFVVKSCSCCCEKDMKK